MGDNIIYRAREVKCSPTPPLNEKPGALHTFGGTEPGRRSPIQDLAAKNSMLVASLNLSFPSRFLH